MTSTPTTTTGDVPHTSQNGSSTRDSPARVLTLPHNMQRLRRDGRDAAGIIPDDPPLRSDAFPELQFDKMFWVEVLSVFRALHANMLNRSTTDDVATSRVSVVEDDPGRGLASSAGASVPLTRDNIALASSVVTLHRQLFKRYLVAAGLAQPNPPLNGEADALSHLGALEAVDCAGVVREISPPPREDEYTVGLRTAIDSTGLANILRDIGAPASAATVSGIVRSVQYTTLDVRGLIRERRSASPTASSRSPLSVLGSIGSSHGDGSSLIASPPKQLLLNERDVCVLLQAVSTAVARRLVASRLYRSHTTPTAPSSATSRRHTSLVADASAAPLHSTGSCRAAATLDDTSASECRRAVTRTLLSSADRRGSVASSLLTSTIISRRHAVDVPASQGSRASRQSSPGSVLRQSGLRVNDAGAVQPVREPTPTRASILRCNPALRSPPVDVNGRPLSPCASRPLSPVSARGRAAVSPMLERSVADSPSSRRRQASPSSRRPLSPSSIVRSPSRVSVISSQQPQRSPSSSSNSLLRVAAVAVGFNADYHKRHVEQTFAHVHSRVQALHISAVTHNVDANPFLTAASPRSGTTCATGPGPSRRNSSPAPIACRNLSPARVPSPTLRHHSVLGHQVVRMGHSQEPESLPKPSSAAATVPRVDRSLRNELREVQADVRGPPQYEY